MSSVDGGGAMKIEEALSERQRPEGPDFLNDGPASSAGFLYDGDTWLRVEMDRHVACRSYCYAPLVNGPQGGIGAVFPAEGAFLR